jgi:RNA polymerase sigma factor (sigma-70 family)
MAKGIVDAVRRHIHMLAGRYEGSQATDRELLRRFAVQQDESAFEILFYRHGAMVRAAGRRVLGNAHDAEDVCQAAFLLLAQKASSQRWQPSVANWLYQTAHLLALKARTAAARRARREGEVPQRQHANPLAEITGQELLAALEEELLLLPEPLRAPLVLCYLEGATRDEAAQRLGCPLATLKNRLQRGRQRLHDALLRRGLALSPVLLGLLAGRHAGDAAAAVALARQTGPAALALAAGRPVEGVISSRVSALLQGGLHPLWGNKLKAALALLLLGGVLSAAGALAIGAQDGKPVDTPPKQAAAIPEKRGERPAAAGNARGATLRYQFKEGDLFRYAVQAKTETTTTTGGDEHSTLMTRAYEVTWRVAGVDTDGNARVKLTIDRVRHEGDSGFPGKFEFDSRKHRIPEGPAQMVRIMTPVLKAHVGAEFTCTVSPRGEVRDFKVPRKLANAVQGTQGIQAMFSPKYFQQVLACPGNVVLPGGPVSPGAGWSDKADQPIAGGHVRMTGEIKATYRGEADRGGPKLQEIALQPTATRIERVPTSGLGPFTLRDHNGKGSLFFDSGKGRLVEAELTQDLEMESLPPGQGEKIFWKMKLSISTKLMPEK